MKRKSKNKASSEPNELSAPISTTNPQPIATRPDIIAQNFKRLNQRIIANNSFAAEGKLIVTNNDDNTVTYGFTDLRVWNPLTKVNKNLTVNDADKFLVTQESYELAKSEFWGRWKIFIQHLFKCNYIKIDQI